MVLIFQVKPDAEDPAEIEATDRIREFFKKIAGDDLEIDWQELQNVLTYALQKGKKQF